MSEGRSPLSLGQSPWSLGPSPWSFDPGTKGTKGQPAGIHGVSSSKWYWTVRGWGVAGLLPERKCPLEEGECNENDRPKEGLCPLGGFCVLSKSRTSRKGDSHVALGTCPLITSHFSARLNVTKPVKNGLPSPDFSAFERTLPWVLMPSMAIPGSHPRRQSVMVRCRRCSCSTHSQTVCAHSLSGSSLKIASTYRRFLPRSLVSAADQLQAASSSELPAGLMRFVEAKCPMQLNGSVVMVSSLPQSILCATLTLSAVSSGHFHKLKSTLAKVANSLVNGAIPGGRRHFRLEICSQTFARVPLLSSYWASSS